MPVGLLAVIFIWLRLLLSVALMVILILSPLVMLIKLQLAESMEGITISPIVNVDELVQLLQS